MFKVRQLSEKEMALELRVQRLAAEMREIGGGQRRSAEVTGEGRGEGRGEESGGRHTCHRCSRNEYEGLSSHAKPTVG